MSEYQRYEFMTVDHPLTREQLEKVKGLSSHIEASSTRAVIEYHWGDFKHNPVGVLREFFDGFLYYANWGSPRFGLRFPHGTLPANLLQGYDLDDYAKFVQHPDYDVLDFEFGELEAYDEWPDFDLGTLIPIREELLSGDLRSLYIAWLAGQRLIGGEDYDYYDHEEDEEEGEDDEDALRVPPIPPGFGTLTKAQQSLTELLQVPEELLLAAAAHSQTSKAAIPTDFAPLVEKLSRERCNEYLVRLAQNEAGLHHLLVKELLALSPESVNGALGATGEHVSYATLVAEGEAVQNRRESEKIEQARQARLRYLQEVHDQQEDYWRQVNEAFERKTSSGYNEATRLLIELRDAAAHFNEADTFQACFENWVRPHMHRPAFIGRLREENFSLPKK